MKASVLEDEFALLPKRSIEEEVSGSFSSTNVSEELAHAPTTPPSRETCSMMATDETPIRRHRHSWSQCPAPLAKRRYVDTPYGGSLPKVTCFWN